MTLPFAPLFLSLAVTASDFVGHWAGLTALVLFVVAYLAVIAEEQLHLRKSQPMLLAAGAIWLLVGLAYGQAGDTTSAQELALHNLLEFAELFLFLLVAMTYVNTIEERGVFNALRVWLVSRGLSLRALFWLTGALAFVLSPVADNLTTALVLGSVVVTLGEGYPRFVRLACINVVVAANAGGVFSPFGDVTTLMVWQDGVIGFFGFLVLFVPSVVSWLIPAGLMALSVEKNRPAAVRDAAVVEGGGLVIVLLFVGTIALTVSFRNFLYLPPALGMMAGLGVLKMYSYAYNHFLRGGGNQLEPDEMEGGLAPDALPAAKPLDTFRQLERVEWDTLMFFYGVILCIGGLGAFGYLAWASEAMYVGLGATAANVLVGVLSAVVDNVPVMFAVLQMHPSMSEGQWLLVTLTTGIGGSILSVGSAAGVALMGLARGVYTFGAHLRWTWAIVLGYVAGVGSHLLINRHLF